MHERTQRAIARLLFIFCCAVPTCLTILSVLVTWTPWYHDRTIQHLQHEFQKEIGLTVKIGSYDHSAPGAWTLTNLILSHPETNQEIAKVRELHWVIQEQEARILMEQPEIQASQLLTFWHAIHDRFLCRPDKTDLPTQISGNDLTIHGGQGGVTLRDVDAWVQSDEQTTLATLQLHLADGDIDSPVLLQMKRQRGERSLTLKPPPRTTLTLNTQGTALPCSAFSDFLPILESLGSEANFAGLMQWETQHDQWSLDLGGSRFDQITLDRLLQNQSHRLSGKATIQFDRCRIEPHERRSDISGSLLARDGLAGRSLLNGASENLNLELLESQQWGQFAGDIPYDLLAIGFNINGTQLQLDGICRSERGYESYPAGIALLLNGYPLVRSTPETVESLRLLSVFAPSHSVPVLLSQQTNWLTQVLLPPSRPLPSQQTAPPRIRSARVWQGGPSISQPK
ncbi:hypothetical protein OAL43_02120 [bacterium]|nr:MULTISPECIES: hypothetical protein [Pirellulaceae]MDB4338606.1 hypothetical protein [Rubripirellula sp.]MDB4678946.1 hypothetical protein [Rhodopirellula sp.]MDC0278979.1 hypothetical protein [bacterium]